KPVGSAAKLFAKCAHKTAGRVVNDDGFATHAGFVHGVSDVDEAVLILRQSMRVSPDQAIGRDKPVVHTLVGVSARSDHWRPATRFMRRLKEKRRQRGRG